VEAPLPDAKAPAIIKARTHRVERYRQSCHPDAGFSAVFVPGLEMMILKCKECNVECVRFAVAKQFNKGGLDGGKDAGQVRLTDA
jgi:hypothetical protein